jgi:Na+/melibiose symporter-like transporter
VGPFRWSTAPDDATPVQKRNFLAVQIDGIGIGLASAAAPFLPVFLTRLGATNLQVGLLTAMPAFTGLFLALLIGRFLQSRRQVVPWYSRMRFLVVMSYALTGIVPFIVPRNYAVPAVLLIWAVATLPQTFVNVAFSVVMNAVAGPKGRYDLMSRRWTILGLTTSVAVAITGEALDQIHFPLNYQLVFMGLSMGGLLSYAYSSRIDLPDAEPLPRQPGLSLRQRFKGYVCLIWNEKPFVSFTAKRFVFLSGTALAAPLFPLYFVRVLNASDAWIGAINTAQTAILLIGYPLWSRQWRLRGARFVLLWTTLGLTLYPALTAFTHHVEWIVIYAGLAGIFQAGNDLVFFDELMKTVPPQYSATFVSLAQSLQYLSTVASPLVGTFLADHIGIGGGLLVGAALRLTGFGLFALNKR